MAITRLDIDEDQWFEYEDRPTHGDVRRIARETARSQRGSDPLEAEDVIVSQLGKAWSVHDSDGNSIPFAKAQFDKVPSDTWGRMVNVLTEVLENNIPNPTTRGF